MWKPLLLLAMVASVAHARIGETEAQIEARYGKPLKTDGDFKAYTANGFTIIVTFLDGRSEGEMFEKPDRAAFSENELAMLMTANGGGRKWTDATPQFDFVRKMWRSADGNLTAVYKTIPPTLVIASRKFAEHQERTQKKEETEKLSGF